MIHGPCATAVSAVHGAMHTLAADVATGSYSPHFSLWETVRMSINVLG